MLSKLPTNVPSHLSLRLLKVHCNSGDLQRARHLFDQIPEPDLRAWTVLISAHTRHGLLKESIKLYTSLRARKIAPDSLLLLIGCQGLCRSERCLIKCPQRDVVSWNVLLTAYFSNRECEKGMALFWRMRNEGVKLDGASWNVCYWWVLE
ncbi:hypothetical protein M0R45_014347 [Rubus argutus]|uniref:Pentatricopeptide repeat-containing protein n=1 Tax=Rubus argutus TaxID=59490 RepID=A0AAW1XL73_RUBAR